jgi:hypothetical protein
VIRRLSFGAAVVAVGACAGAGARPTPAAIPAAAAPPTPPASTPARRPGADPIRFGPSVLHYLIAQHVDLHQSAQGQESSSQLGFRVFTTATVSGPAVSAGYPATFTVDSIIADSGLALPVTVNLAAARGLTFTGVLRQDGEFLNSIASDSAIALGLRQILGTFRDFYPHLPPGGLRLGAVWTDTISRSDAAGAFDKLTITAINNSHASAIEDRGGVHSVRIDIGSQITLAGSGTQGGQPLTVKGTGSRRSIEFVAVDGRYLGGESLDSTDLTFTLPQQGLAVPVRRVTHLLVQVLP